MKRSCPDHPKTRRLARLLGIPIYSAVGLLELLFHFAGKHAPRGDIGRWGDSEIAEAVGWTEDPEKLLTALIEAGYVDRSTTHRLLLHDWPEHADEAVKKYLGRNQLTFAAHDDPGPKTPPDGSNRDGGGKCLDKSCLPQPLPEPSQSHCQKPEPSHAPPGGELRVAAAEGLFPSEENEPPNGQARTSAPTAIDPEEFRERWNAIEGVQACRTMTPARVKAFRARCRDPAWLEGLDDALARVAASSFCRGGGARGWKAHVDWFLAPDTQVEILEGKFDDRPSHERKGQAAQASSEGGWIRGGRDWGAQLAGRTRGNAIPEAAATARDAVAEPAA